MARLSAFADEVSDDFSEQVRFLVAEEIGHIEIRFVDRKVAELYDYFTARYDGDVLFFVTSDHGRSLRDDLEIGHGPRWRKEKKSVHDYNLRIPFAILPSERVAQSRRVAGPSSLVDFVPTLLEWLDLPARHPHPGVSLLPAIAEGEPLPRDRGIYARHGEDVVHPRQPVHVLDLHADDRLLVGLGDAFLHAHAV